VGFNVFETLPKEPPTKRSGVIDSAGLSDRSELGLDWNVNFLAAVRLVLLGFYGLDCGDRQILRRRVYYFQQFDLAVFVDDGPQLDLAFDAGRSVFTWLSRPASWLTIPI